MSNANANTSKPTKIVKLSELSNMAQVIAKAVIDEKGEYYCVINEQAVKVVR